MYRLVVLVAVLLSHSVIANQFIDTSADSHEMILKLKQAPAEKTFSDLPALIQSIPLQPMGSSRNASHSNRAQLLSRLFRVNTQNMTPHEMLTLSKELEKLADVEYCSLSPVYPRLTEKVDTPINSSLSRSATPDYSDMQGYLKDTVNGIYAEYAWDLGIYGEEVTFRDVEGAWDFQHEDLGNIFVGLESNSTTGIDHGTNTIGVLMAQHNGFGVNGATPNAEMYTYSIFNEAGNGLDPARTFAIAKAIEDANAGDIIILELQDRGYQQATYPDFGPADIKIAVWELIQAATSDSILVVAAAGNGKQNLDGASYESYRNRGDNGSIIVGGGKPEDQSKNSSSSYGEMVRLQGWGYYVTTTGASGISDWTLQSNTHAEYTNNYTGTSSATPIVAAAMGLVQSWAKKNQGRYLGPFEMRELLISTGTPHTGDYYIGSLPNVKAAIEKLQAGSTSAQPGSITKNSASLKLTSVSAREIQLTVPKSGLYRVTFHSLNGRVISSFSTNLTQGVSTVPVQKIESGMYIMKVEGVSVSSTFKCFVP